MRACRHLPSIRPSSRHLPQALEKYIHKLMNTGKPSLKEQLFPTGDTGLPSRRVPRTVGPCPKKQTRGPHRASWDSVSQKLSDRLCGILMGGASGVHHSGGDSCPPTNEAIPSHNSSPGRQCRRRRNCYTGKRLLGPAQALARPQLFRQLLGKSAKASATPPPAFGCA